MNSGYKFPSEPLIEIFINGNNGVTIRTTDEDGLHVTPIGHYARAIQIAHAILDLAETATWVAEEDDEQEELNA
jgi:hypothetical protein